MFIYSGFYIFYTQGSPFVSHPWNLWATRVHSLIYYLFIRMRVTTKQNAEYEHIIVNPGNKTTKKLTVYKIIFCSYVLQFDR